MRSVPQGVNMIHDVTKYGTGLQNESDACVTAQDAS